MIQQWFNNQQFVLVQVVQIAKCGGSEMSCGNFVIKANFMFIGFSIPTPFHLLCKKALMRENVVLILLLQTSSLFSTENIGNSTEKVDQNVPLNASKSYAFRGDFM